MPCTDSLVLNTLLRKVRHGGGFPDSNASKVMTPKQQTKNSLICYFPGGRLCLHTHQSLYIHPDTTHMYVRGQSKANENKSPSYTGSCPAIKLALTGTDDSYTSSECFHSAMRSNEPKEKSLGSSRIWMIALLLVQPALAVGWTRGSPVVLSSPNDPVIITALILTSHS